MRGVKTGFLAGRHARNLRSTLMTLLIVLMLKLRRLTNLLLIILAVAKGSRSTARFKVNKFARLTVLGLPVEELLTQKKKVTSIHNTTLGDQYQSTSTLGHV